jgi:hypothetical protein
MRVKFILAAIIAAWGMAAGSAGPAAAFGWKKSHCHHHHYEHRRRPYYHCHGRDPYAYRYEPRGYYPYYKSDYWRPAHKVRRLERRFRMPRYHPAWGKYKRRYHHARWHKRHHGGHPFWHW